MAETPVPSQKAVDVVYVVERIGLIGVLCIAMIAMLFVTLVDMRKDGQRNLRNTRAIQQALKIPIIQDKTE